MKIYFAVLLLSALLLAGLADGSYWFKVINVTPIEMTANSEANLTVSVKGMGSERAYVELVFRDMPEGLRFTCPRMIKNVFPAGVTDYSCTVKAGDVPPGNYSFVVDAVAPGSPSGKMIAFINVVDRNAEAKSGYEEEAVAQLSPPAYPSPAVELNLSSEAAREALERDEAAKEAPFFGAVTAILGLLAVLGWMKRHR